MNLHAPLECWGAEAMSELTPALRAPLIRRFPRTAIGLPIGGLEACNLSRRRFVATGHGLARTRWANTGCFVRDA